MTSWWKRFRALTHSDRPIARFHVAARNDGIVIEDRQLGNSDKFIVLPWKEVSQIIAYKRDVYAGDLICLGVELADTRVIELDETMHGWEEFMAALPDHLAGAMNMEEIFVRLAAEQNLNASVTVFECEKNSIQEVVTASGERRS